MEKRSRFPPGVKKNLYKEWVRCNGGIIFKRFFEKLFRFLSKYIIDQVSWKK
jgi:hypothetical protein